MKPQPEIRISHVPGFQANILAESSMELRKQAQQSFSALKQLQLETSQNSNIKAIVNCFLSAIAIGLFFTNIFLDAPLIQNIYNFEGKNVNIAYIIVIGLAGSALLFGILMEEGLDPKLTDRPFVNSSNMSDYAKAFHSTTISPHEIKRWLLFLVGIIGAGGIAFAIYRLNIVRANITSQLEGIDFGNNEMAIVYLPVLLYISETLASIGLVPTIHFLHISLKSKNLHKNAKTNISKSNNQANKAIAQWTAYILDIKEYNDEQSKSHQSIPPNAALRKILSDQEKDIEEEAQFEDIEIGKTAIEYENNEYENLANNPL